jgi:hypothetical protein
MKPVYRILVIIGITLLLLMLIVGAISLALSEGASIRYLSLWNGLSAQFCWSGTYFG